MKLRNIGVLSTGVLLIVGLTACASAPVDRGREGSTVQSAGETTTESESSGNIETEVNEITLEDIPSTYLTPAEEQGQVIRLDYESNTYDEENAPLSKTAYVYLPFGYDENSQDAQYNIFYLMHGGGGSAEYYLGGENGERPLKHLLDNMVQNGDMEPTIVVTPTYYPNGSSGSDGELTANFHNELISDLLPAVESQYHTYAEYTDEAGLMQSREHRAFGGFSMGAVTTWYTFINNLDFFKYYMPMSGDCWVTGQMGGSDTGHVETSSYLADVARNSEYGVEEYYIYAMTGSDDIAYDALTEQVEAMKTQADVFIYNPDFSQGNFYYGVVPGGEHNYTYMNQYIYNALPSFWR